MALTANQKRFIEAYLENPLLPTSEVAPKVGISPITVYNWKTENKNGFKDELQKRLDEKWEEAKYMASDTMFSLARGGDFKAAKYILDYAGYKPVEKVEQKVDNTITIEVGIDEN